MMKGFKQFLLRGNVVNLAVAVVIMDDVTSMIGRFIKPS